MIFAEVIGADSSLSLGLVMAGLALMLGAGVGAIVSSVTTRNKVAELERNLLEFQKWRDGLQKWREQSSVDIAVFRERLTPGRGSRPLIQARNEDE